MRRTPRPTADQLATWRVFLRAHRRVVARLDEDLRRDHGLPLEWYDVLVQLADAGGRLRMSELAASVLVTAPNCTRLVDRMQAAGLVDRLVDPDDARARLAVVTDEGRRRLRDAAPTHLGGVHRHFAGFLAADPDAAAVIAGFLGRVDGSVDRGDADGSGD